MYDIDDELNYDEFIHSWRGRLTMVAALIVLVLTLGTQARGEDAPIQPNHLVIVGLDAQGRYLSPAIRAGNAHRQLRRRGEFHEHSL